MAMSGKESTEKRFDDILQRMLQSKRLLLSEISAKIQVRRKRGGIRKELGCREGRA